MISLWDHYTLFEPVWEHRTLKNFTSVGMRIFLIQFLMALRDEFKTTRISLLHIVPLPSFDQAMSILIFEEVQLLPMQSQHTNIMNTSSVSQPIITKSSPIVVTATHTTNFQSSIEC